MIKKNSAVVADKVKGKKAAVLGLGVNNLKLVRFLAELGAKITVFDRSDEKTLTANIETVKDYTDGFSLGENYLSGLKGFDLIFRTPGMRPDIPEIAAEVANGAELTSEMDVFMEACPAETIGITGSDGKTTTTTLIYTMLSRQGYKCRLGGNIGYPLLWQVDEIGKNEKVVLELSSFQLFDMKYSPSTAVITNIKPNHLDVHKDYAEYIEAKKNIYRSKSNDRLILNTDNDATFDIYNEAFELYPSKAIWGFGRHAEKLRGSGIIEENGIIYRIIDGSRERIMNSSDIKLPGGHNTENYMAAIAAISGMTDNSVISDTAVSFGGVEHRLAFVREVNGAKYYNDSIATSPSRTIAAIKSFKNKIILIAGGKAKGIPFDSLGEYLSSGVKTLILTGATSGEIEKSIVDYVNANPDAEMPEIIKADGLTDAVNKANKKAVEGDNVVLSPASTSYDAFKNFMERGKYFIDAVSKL